MRSHVTVPATEAPHLGRAEAIGQALRSLLMTSLTVEPIAIPSRLGLDSLGWGTAVVGIPDLASALFAAHKGMAVRCVRVDPDGGFTVISKVRGLLRDAVREEGSYLWVLATHGLHLIDLASDAVVETITAGLPKYSARLNRLDANHLIASTTGSASAAIVSAPEGRVVQRIRMPTVDLVLGEGDLTLCSFERGLARRVGPTWHRVAEDRRFETAISPVRAGSAIAAVLTDLVPAAPGSDVTVPRSRGVVALFDLDLKLVSKHKVEGIQRIHGQAPDGSLLGVTQEEVVILDPATIEETARSRRLGWNPATGAMGMRMALVVAEDKRLAPSVAILRW